METRGDEDTSVYLYGENWKENKCCRSWWLKSWGWAKEEFHWRSIVYHSKCLFFYWTKIFYHKWLIPFGLTPLPLWCIPQIYATPIRSIFLTGYWIKSDSSGRWMVTYKWNIYIWAKFCQFGFWRQHPQYRLIRYRFQWQMIREWKIAC